MICHDARRGRDPATHNPFADGPIPVRTLSAVFTRFAGAWSDELVYAMPAREWRAAAAWAQPPA